MQVDHSPDRWTIPDISPWEFQSMLLKWWPTCTIYLNTDLASELKVTTQQFSWTANFPDVWPFTLTSVRNPWQFHSSEVSLYTDMCTFLSTLRCFNGRSSQLAKTSDECLTWLTVRLIPQTGANHSPCVSLAQTSWNTSKVFSVTQAWLDTEKTLYKHILNAQQESSLKHAPGLSYGFCLTYVFSTAIPVTHLSRKTFKDKLERDFLQTQCRSWCSAYSVKAMKTKEVDNKDQRLIINWLFLLKECGQF